MIDFAAIKAAVPAREAALRYGLAVGRNDMAICPFHGEKTPSLKLYPGDRGFYCFGCGAGGDVINFTARLFNLTNKQAAEKLDADFSLGLTGKPYNAAAELLREAEQKKKREEEAKRAEIMRQLLAKRRCLWNHRYDQRGMNQVAVQYLDYVIDNYNEFPTEEVSDIARRIPCVTECRQHMQGGNAVSHFYHRRSC